MAGLAIGAIALAAASVLVLVWAAVSHLRFAAAERRRRLLEMRLRPAALALIDEDEQPVFTSRAEAEVFADLLGRYSRQLQGDARARIAGFFERSGAVGLVVAALRDRRPWTRAEAAFSLGDMGSPAAVEPLLDALRDRDVDVRAAAARSLGRLGAPEAVEPLLELVSTRSLPRAVVGRALLEIGPAAIPSLLRLVDCRDPLERAAAIQLVGLLGDAGDAAPLIGRLQDGDAAVRVQAAAALGRLGAADAERAVRRALGDPSEQVRAAAAETLGAIGSRADVDALVTIARSDAFEPARAAARSVVRLDGRRATAAADGPHLAEAVDLAALA